VASATITTAGGASPPIEHVVVILQENDSFDNLLGQRSASRTIGHAPAPRQVGTNWAKGDARRLRGITEPYDGSVVHCPS
jgi:phospholipase C